MATVTRAPGKSDFIKQVLGKNPQATFKAVNEAWTGAGNEGSISQALVNKMRSEAGLSGNLRTNGKVETPRRSREARPHRQEAGAEAQGRARDQGKTSFLKEFLNDHPEGNVKAVNEAWTKAGFDGSISNTLVSKMRAQLGLTGNLRSKPVKTKAASGTKPYTGKKRGRKPKGFTAEATPVDCDGRDSWSQECPDPEAERTGSRHRPPRLQGHGDRRPPRDRGFAASGQAAPLREADPGLSRRFPMTGADRRRGFPGVSC